MDPILVMSTKIQKVIGSCNRIHPGTTNQTITNKGKQEPNKNTMAIMEKWVSVMKRVMEQIGLK